MSPSTVKTHIGKIYEKLGAHNRASAVIAAVRLGSSPTTLVRTARRPAPLSSSPSAQRSVVQITPQESLHDGIAPGPMMTMNSAGKMQSSSGNRILTVTF